MKNTPIIDVDTKRVIKKMEENKKEQKKTPYQQTHTMINVSKNTRERLRQHGSFGESYDDIVVRLLDFWEKNH